MADDHRLLARIDALTAARAVSIDDLMGARYQAHNARTPRPPGPVLPSKANRRTARCKTCGCRIWPTSERCKPHNDVFQRGKPRGGRLGTK